MKKLLFIACASLMMVGCSTKEDDAVLDEMKCSQEVSINADGKANTGTKALKKDQKKQVKKIEKAEKKEAKKILK